MSDIPTSADIELIRRILPQRYPFLMVDKVRDIVPNESCVGIKNVTMNEPHFNGHFPAAPIMPGVMIVEALAQTASVMVGLSRNLIDEDLLVYFLGIETAKFRRKIVPGDVLELHVKSLRGGSKILKFDGRGIVDGEVAVEARFTAIVDRREE